MGCVVSSFALFAIIIINTFDDLFFRKITKLKRILGNKKPSKEKYCFKMTQYQIILANLKTIIEKQDKIFILMDKIVKFLEHFMPLIDWVRLFFINQHFLLEFFGNSTGVLRGIFWNSLGS